MNDADYKSLEARIADLEERMDKVVDGALALTDAVATINDNTKKLFTRTDLLREAHEALRDSVIHTIKGVRILGDDYYGKKS